MALAIGACVNPSSPPEPQESSVPHSFTNDGLRFSGTLWLPKGNGPFPAVIMVGGNGAWRPAYPYFDLLRDAFRARGIAVVYYDRRGEGGSEGDFGRSSFEALATDVVAAAAAVQQAPQIDGTRVGAWGHSMGGWIVGLAASTSPKIAFVLTAAGPGVGPLEQTLYERANADRAAGIPEATVGEMAALRRLIVEYYTRRTSQSFDSAQTAYAGATTASWFPLIAGWRELQGVGANLPSPATLNAIDKSNPDVLRWFGRDALYEPAPALRRIQVPYLAIFGDADTVTPRDASIVALTAGFGVNSRGHLLTTRSFDSAGHMITTRQGAQPSALAPGYLDLMTEWIQTAVRH